MWAPSKNDFSSEATLRFQFYSILLNASNRTGFIGHILAR